MRIPLAGTYPQRSRWRTERWQAVSPALIRGRSAWSRPLSAVMLAVVLLVAGAAVVQAWFVPAGFQLDPPLPGTADRSGAVAPPSLVHEPPLPDEGVQRYAPPVVSPAPPR